MPKLISGKTKGFVRRNLASLDLLGVNLLLPFILNRQEVSLFLSQRHAFTATYGCVTALRITASQRRRGIAAKTEVESGQTL